MVPHPSLPVERLILHPADTHAAGLVTSTAPPSLAQSRNLPAPTSGRLPEYCLRINRYFVPTVRLLPGPLILPNALSRPGRPMVRAPPTPPASLAVVTTLRRGWGVGSEVGSVALLDGLAFDGFCGLLAVGYRFIDALGGTPVNWYPSFVRCDRRRVASIWGGHAEARRRFGSSRVFGGPRPGEFGCGKRMAVGLTRTIWFAGEGRGRVSTPIN